MSVPVSDRAVGRRQWVMVSPECQRADCYGGPRDGDVLPVASSGYALEGFFLSRFGLHLTGQGYRQHVNWTQYRDYMLLDVSWRWDVELVEWLSARTYARLGGYQGA